MSTATAVIEYQYRGYVPPHDEEAWDIEAAITHAAGIVLETGARILADLRTELKEAGLRKIGANITNRYSNPARPSQLFPQWREVWKHKDVVAASHNSQLSPRAQKNVAAGKNRQRSYNPTLARTSTRLILQPPHRGSVEYQHDFKRWVKRNLPAYKLNHKRDWYEAELTEENYNAVFTADTELNISDGARQWYKEKGEERMKGEERLLGLVRTAEKRFPELTSRPMNAAEIVRKGKVQRISTTTFRVQSPGSEDQHTVDIHKRTCTCADHAGLYPAKAPQVNGAPLCKHRLAVLMRLHLEQPATTDAGEIHRQQKRLDSQVMAAKAGRILL